MNTDTNHPDAFRVDVAEGKYSVLYDGKGSLSALRYGEPWQRNLVGDNLVYALASELHELRRTFEFLIPKGPVFDDPHGVFLDPPTLPSPPPEIHVPADPVTRDTGNPVPVPVSGPRPIKDWLAELPPGYRERALANYDPEFARNDDGSLCETGTLSLAIDSAFNWETAPEGEGFWEQVWIAIVESTPLPPLPPSTGTPESGPAAGLGANVEPEEKP